MCTSLLVPHDDVDKTSVEVSTCLVVVLEEANEYGLSKMVVCDDVSNNVTWVSMEKKISYYI